MAGSRVIRKGFVDSDRVSGLDSWFAECFFHRLLLVADDFGFYDARPAYLRAQLFCTKLDKVREADVSRALLECERAGLIRFYEVDGKPYMEVLRYGQRCDKTKPKWPVPPWFAGRSAGSSGKFREVPAIDEVGEFMGNEKVELSSTVVTRAAVEPGSPPMRLEERAEFGRWLCRLGEVVPMLQRLNLNHPLPRKVEEEAQQAYRLVPLSEATLRLIGRYYAAEAVKSYRPDSLEFFFRDLPDVLQHAANWCRWADKQQRKAEATARRKAAEAAQGVVGEGSPMVSAEEAAEAFREMRR